MDKTPGLPSPVLEITTPIRTSSSRRLWRIIAFSILIFLVIQASLFRVSSNPSPSSHVPLHAERILNQCRSLTATPGPPTNFAHRTHSDRFVPGTPPTLITNARIWTGGESGREQLIGDVLLDKGIIKRAGQIDHSVLREYREKELVEVDARGAWLSPGIVDLHSHLGVDSVPALRGASDTNSVAGITIPWMRSLDGLNTHDDAYALSISGGVTSALVLPGSADAIGGQAFPIKLRKTEERSSSAMVIELPFAVSANVNETEGVNEKGALRWRYMKHACGENPSRVYDGTRMDTIWAFRKAYDKARQIKIAQDEFCAHALAGRWDAIAGDHGDVHPKRSEPEIPFDLQWEALVDVLRGRVKVNVHCYEAVDLDALVRLSNEFEFPIAAFHHAHETYLVPDLLKKVYGHPPAIAMFATDARYKREAYRGSEFAAKILADHGLKVVMKSDHPVLNSRYLLYEAQQAHYYGLPEHLALASVTSTPAEVMGLDHRIGFIREGHDADIVLWDSHPLALGATPKQVWIDGIAQISSPHVVSKPTQFQRPPRTPDFSREARDAVKYEGLPPLTPGNRTEGVVAFLNVSSVYLRAGGKEVKQIRDENSVVVVSRGKIVCSGSHTECTTSMSGHDVLYVDLDGGSIAPGLVSFGAPLGLEEIAGESSTTDGYVYDPLIGGVPKILGGDEAIIRAVDGLQFAGRDMFLAYRAGVTSAITAPTQRFGLLAGLGTAFSTSAAHKLENGAVIQDVTAVHVTIRHVGTPSVSTQFAALWRLLLGSEGESGWWFERVREGEIPLVVHIESADAIATLLSLKKEVESHTGSTSKITLVGAAEAHLLAKEIGEAGVGVIVIPSRPFPSAWESRRILPGPPLTKDSAIRVLLAHNVTVGVGIDEIWMSRNIRFDVGWAALEADGSITKAEALALASTNLEELLGVSVDADGQDFVVTRGGDLLGLESKVVGIISPRQGSVDLF